MIEALLGLDVGTTNIKGVAYSATGQPLAEASRATPSVADGPRRAHHDPEALWGEVVAVIREVVARLDGGARLAGLAIASIGESGVPLDARGQMVYPIIAWYDERTAPQAAWWAQEVGEKSVYQHTGLPLGHTFTLSKLMWLRAEEPERFAKMARWLCVSDYMAYRLTGEGRMGYSLASRTMAFDLRARRWSAEMLAWAGIDAALLPELAAEGSLVGQVTASAAHETGLAPGTPVYVGGHDHVCGALAVGAYEPGVVLDSTGTTEAELVTLEDVEEHLQAADTSFCLGSHVVRDRYYSIGSVLGAGSMVNWLAALLWPGEALAGREQALEALTQAAAASPLGAQGLYILPHLAGAGSPNRNSTARGVMVGLSLAHTRGDLARAGIEGLAYELRVLWEALERFTGHPITRVVTVGGGARNTLWSQIKADVTGKALAIPGHTEAVTLGAAILAGIGAGIYRDTQDAQAQLRLPFNEVRPEAESARQYDALYRTLRERVRPLAVELGRGSLILP